MIDNGADPRQDLRGYREALGTFGTGVAVVTAVAEKQCLGMTINSFASVSLRPPLVLWSVGESSANYRQFCAAERFAIHILGADQRTVSDHFAQTGDNKFQDAAWEFDQHGVPRLLGCIARFECRRRFVYPGGDHHIIVGEVEYFEKSPGDPLLFVRGLYLSDGRDCGGQ